MNWRDAAYLIIGMFVGVILHEYMHGRIADLLGDHTARNAGRLTLNPVPHIDPFGTVILPVALVLISRGSFLFGYAKPVPVNPYFMKKPKRDMLLVALAGPTTNFGVAVGFALMGMVIHLAGVSTTTMTSQGLVMTELYNFFYMAVVINIWLGIFNLLPIPPLDGSHVLEYFLSNEARVNYERIAPFGFIIMIAFFWLAGSAIFGALTPLFHLLGRMMGIPF